MAGILELAREIRLHPVKCPHCGRSVGTADLVRELFRKIVERTAEGERVEVTRFGVFEARPHRAGKAVSKIARLGRGVIEYPETLVLRFRASRVAKRILRKAHTERDQ